MRPLRLSEVRINLSRELLSRRPAIMNAASGPAPTLEMPLHGGGVDAQTASVVPDFRSSLLRPPLFAAKMPLGEEETHESSWCPHGLLCQDKCCVQMVPRVPGASWAASSLTGSRQCSSLHSHLPASGLSLRRKSSWSQEGHLCHRTWTSSSCPPGTLRGGTIRSALNNRDWPCLGFR